MPSPVFQSRVEPAIYEAFVRRIERDGLDQRVVIEAMMVGFSGTDQKGLRKLIADRQAFLEAKAESQAKRLLDSAKRDARAGRPKQ